ncbi:MAG: SCO family protein [Hyphomicrobium sp.]
MAGVAMAPSHSRAAPEGSRWNAKHFTNTELTTQDGKKVRFYDDLLKDKTFVINFIFTGCSQLCPLTTARLAAVQDELGDAVGRDIFFYSVSLDPMTDTPEKLKKFAESFKIGPGWLFLTGHPDDVKIVRDKLGERSRDKSEHQAIVILANDKTGEWRKDSAMSEQTHLVETIRSLDPAWRDRVRTVDARMSESNGTIVKNIPGYALFKKVCASCHTVGKGDSIGPDLAGVSERRDRDWLRKFISRPDKMREAGDPLALELFEKYNRVLMPYLGLNETDAEDALSYIDGETLKAKTAANPPAK